MANQNEGGIRTFQASGALSANIIVDVQSDGTIKATAPGVLGMGVTQADAADAGYVPVRLWSAPGTWDIQATAATITPGSSYAIVTGGYVGTATGTTYPAALEALVSGVASNGIVCEFALIF